MSLNDQNVGDMTNNELAVVSNAVEPTEEENLVLGGVNIVHYSKHGYISITYEGKDLINPNQLYVLEVLKPELLDEDTNALFKLAMQKKTGYEILEERGYVFGKKPLVENEIVPEPLTRDEVADALKDKSLNLGTDGVASKLGEYDDSFKDPE